MIHGNAASLYEIEVRAGIAFQQTVGRIPHHYKKSELILISLDLFCMLDLDLSMILFPSNEDMNVLVPKKTVICLLTHDNDFYYYLPKKNGCYTQVIAFIYDDERAFDTTKVLFG